MPNSTINYTEVNDNLTELFKDRLPEKLAEIQSENIEPLFDWCNDTYHEILKIKRDVEFRHLKKIEILEKKQPELEKIIENFGRSAIYNRWKDAIKESVDLFPEEIIEYQSNARFTITDEDSLKIKNFKRIKSTAKTLSDIFQNNRENGHWKQSVPIRNICRYHLLANQSLTETFIADQYKLLASGIDLILEISMNSSEEKTDLSHYRDDFKLDFVGEIEDHLQKAIAFFKSNKENITISLDEVLQSCRNDAEKVDTLELKKVKFSKETVEKSTLKINGEAENLEKMWNLYLQTQYSDFKIQVEIARYGWAAYDVQKQLLEYTHQFFRDYCYLPMEEGVNIVKELSSELKNKAGKNLTDKDINQLREKVNEEFKEKLLSHMYDKKSQEKLIGRIQAVISNLQLESQQFTEVVKLSQERQISHPEPQIKVDTIKWKSLAGRFFKQKAIRELDPGSKNLAQFIQKMAAEVEEALRIVDINLMAALESKDSDQEEESQLEIALGGLSRAHKLFEESIKSVRGKQDEYETLIYEKLPSALHELSGLMMSRSYDKFEFQDKALQVKERALNWRVQLKKVVAEFADGGELAWRFFAKKFKDFRKTAARFLGFKSEEVVSVREKRDLTEYLSTNKTDRSLPFVYKKLFSNESLADERFYVIPNLADPYLRDSYADWVKKLDANVLIVGEKGSGKSSAFSFMQKNILEDEEVIQIKFEKTIHTEEDLLKQLSSSFGYKSIKTREQFIEKIKGKRKGVVVCIENLQNIFIRNIHGFDALESFWVILSATRENLFWVVTCSRYSWKFIEKISGADQYFSHLVDVDTLGEEKLKKAILSRHRATGYDIQFEANQFIQKTRAFRKKIGNDEEIQDYLEEYFFQRLAKVSEGNISIAIIFWLQSVSKFDEETFYIAPIEITDVDKLEIPSRQVLFTLASLVIHDRLTTEEMAMSLHQDYNVAQLMLTRLKSKGIVLESEFGYSLNHLVYRQVVRLLKRRNIIH